MRVSEVNVNGDWGRVVRMWLRPHGHNMQIGFISGNSSIEIPDFSNHITPLLDPIYCGGCPGAEQCIITNWSESINPPHDYTYDCVLYIEDQYFNVEQLWKTTACEISDYQHPWFDHVTCSDNEDQMIGTNQINYLFSNYKWPNEVSGLSEPFGLQVEVVAPVTGKDLLGEGCRVADQATSGFNNDHMHNVDSVIEVHFSFEIAMECKSADKDYCKDQDQDGYCEYNYTADCLWNLPQDGRLKISESHGTECAIGEDDDPDLPQLFYHDYDGDTYGDPGDSERACSQPSNHVDNNDDCDDDDEFVNPNTEWCADEDGDFVCNDPNDTKTQCDKPENYTNLHYVADENQTDNCPTIKNKEQENSDSDGWGDVCDNCPRDDNQDQADGDSDKIGDVCDNCPSNYNPRRPAANPYAEIITHGAITAGNGYWKRYTNRPSDYMWQSDMDLDGIGDICDVNVGYNGGYSCSAAVVKEQSLMGKIFSQNKTVGVKIAGGFYDGGIPFFSNGQHRVHYCGADLSDYCLSGVNEYENKCIGSRTHWDSLCEVEQVENRDIGRSHATISSPKPNGEVVWKHIAWKATQDSFIGYADVNNHKNSIPVPFSYNETAAYWNWRADIYNKYKCNIDNRYQTIAICENASGGIKKGTPVYYNLSSNVTGGSNDYLDSNDNVNKNYFRNSYTRPDNASTYDTIGKWAMATRLNVKPRSVAYRTMNMLNLEDLKDTYRDFIGTNIDANSTPLNAIPRFSDHVFDDYKSLTKYKAGGSIPGVAKNYDLVAHDISIPDQTTQFIDGERKGVTYAIARVGDDVYEYHLLVNYAPSSDWHTVGTITNYADYQIKSSASAIHNNTIYLAGGEEDVPQIKNIYKIVRNGDDFVVEMVAPTSISEGAIRLITGLGKLYLIADNNGATSTWAINPENGIQTLVTLGISPVFKTPFNIIGTETGIYLAGKYDPNNVEDTIIAKLTDSDGWHIIHSTVSADTEKLIMNEINGKIVMTDILSDNPMTTRIELNLTDDTINIEPVESFDIYGVEEVQDTYCLSEESGFVLGGRLIDDVCTPFTEALFSSIAIGNTVHAVEGLENRLIVGTGNDVKIYDITEPLAPQLLHTQSVYGPAADMVIYNNKIIIAVENGIDTIELDTYAYSHYPTYGTSKALTVYNEKLYVGDGQGIKVLNPNTLDILQQVNTSGDVTKLEILDGVLYTFEWSGLKRFDVDTLISIPTDYYYVYNPELFEYDGSLYISKNGNIVRLTFNGTTVIEDALIGDPVEFRSNYGYGDYTYFPDGTTLRVSTMEEIPEPVCGNGVIEDGEICDGNSVACTTLSGDYTSGNAPCNSMCSGYNESGCEEDDGW